MKRKLYFLLTLIIGFSFSIKAFAAAPIIKEVTHLENDLYQIVADANGGKIVAYLVGNDISRAIAFTNSSTTGYISAPNGNHYVWVRNSAGEYSEPVIIKVTDSCSNTFADNSSCRPYSSIKMLFSSSSFAFKVINLLWLLSFHFS